MGKEKILVFDAQQSNIEILKSILEEFDFKIYGTNSKECFFELLQENEFNLIFYDVNGELQNISKTLKKIASTELNQNALVVLTSDINAQNIEISDNIISSVQKPFNIEFLKSLVRTFIRINANKEAAIKDLYNSLACFVHDLKTPLVARDYASKMLLDGSSLLSESQKEVLQELHLSTKYLLALTNNFLAKYKYENSKIVLSKSLRDIALDLREVLFEIKYYAKSKFCEVLLEVQDECFAQYDEIGIKRIFYNLLINAIKYSPKNSEIKITLVEKSGKVHLIVENYAEEIEKSKFKNIFKKFVSCGKNADSTGCGIGLAICKKIAKMHKGDISAKIEKLQNGKSDKLCKIIFEMTLPSIENKPCSAKT